VGKVLSFQTNVPTPDAADPNLDPDNMRALLAHPQRIGISLETAGYAKYRDMPSRAEVNAYRPTSGHSFTQQLAQGLVSGPGGDPASMLKPAWKPVEEGFSRQVVMSYGASWTSNFKKAFQRKERPGSASAAGAALAEEPVTRPSHRRQGSASTIGSVDSADGRHSPTLITQPGPGLKPKGYVFLSPWNGRCEFRTSSNGRSLKCRHILDPADARLDPREVAQSIREAQATGRSRGDELASALVGAKPVSELRFNLPRRTAHKATDRGGGLRDSRSGPLSKLFHHRSRSSDEESEYEDDDGEFDSSSTPMDLNLGKENAGGGNRGKRAKLGKLIIHDEGLKMLDLVVAANIGVWWTTWGRNA
jgi:NADH dehydrogenase (ubiquinone) Fe-S protein 8